MKIGFGRRDITPRVGVELCGFGAYRNRHSIGVRDRLWARAMAVEQGGKTLALVSCDLVGVARDKTRAVRRLVTEATGLPPDAVMVACTHTHSGPNTYGGLIGWGDSDQPYDEVLPRRIAEAAILAVQNLQEATLAHAEVPCEGIGQNREYDRDALPLDEVLQDGWRPLKPELTDTTCHVMKAEAAGRLIGFVTYFGCHPVVCCQATRFIHGDFVGVATNMLERDNPGSVGLFLQGANGDVNTCVVHKPEQESLLALDVIAGRYANSVRNGLAVAKAIRVDAIGSALNEVTFSRKKLGIEELRRRLAEQENVLGAAGASDADPAVGMATVYAVALRRLIGLVSAGQSVEPPTETHGFRLGPLLMLGSPFETFQSIKNEVKAKTGVPLTLVLSCVNDCLGYAPDHEKVRIGGYAVDNVPLMLGSLPFVNVHDELVNALLDVRRGLT